MNKLKIFFSLVLSLCLIGVFSPNVSRAETQLDYDVPNGHFYTQGNGQGGAGGTGFTISNDGGIPFWNEFQRWGGVEILGYPVSRRFVYKGFTIQVMQRAVFQWNPTDRAVYFLNTFDELHAAGLDSWLRTVRSVPNQGTFDEVGKSWDQIVEGRLALLNANPAMRTKFYSVRDPIPFFGLPTSSVEDFGILSVIRCQRNVLQQWKVDVPWAKAGEVTIANGGDIAKEAGLFDQSALIPELPPGVTPPPTPTSTGYAFSQYGPIEYGANCGLTQVKIYAADVNDNPLYDIRFHIRAIDGWEADSNATGCCLYAPGWTDFTLASEPKAGIWSLWAIDANGNRISPAVGFATDARDCGEGGSGHQIVTVHWKAN